MIEVRGLQKKYGHRIAVRDIGFLVRKGEVVGFLGPNGAGKSTTMKMITGYMSPTQGQVTVAGFDIFENPLEVKRRIGYLPENPPIYSDMFVEDYLRFVAGIKGVDKSRVRSLVNAAIDKTNIGDVKNRMIGNLSKGYKQRVGLAQAIVSDPEVLILDEPTVGLDPKQVSEVRNLILQLKGQHTIILSTHILSEVQAVCEKVIIINQGSIVAEDSIAGLSRRLTGGGKMMLKVLRQADKVCAQLTGLSGVHGAKNMGNFLEIEFDGKESTVEMVAREVVQLGAGLTELKVESMGLEDIFIKLTSQQPNMIA